MSEKRCFPLSWHVVNNGQPCATLADHQRMWDHAAETLAAANAEDAAATAGEPEPQRDNQAVETLIGADHGRALQSLSSCSR